MKKSKKFEPITVNYVLSVSVANDLLKFMSDKIEEIPHRDNVKLSKKDKKEIATLVIGHLYQEIVDDL